ncbi:uncharacterized protein LOC110458044 isoform X2 [Mizuhopecten yessoensis]|uniref:uncharacterized protein LOC110458044 isoform X1 n=1 Tax=Mizuhopecten yessoensis TaxID=6573 RepID=UPI000B45BF77|nr:uncharacterized protein LOC110458044 isoform X1 [Mizuhopecten yessoensis]XP_021365264.1 uncharacterized protein LOC110458044 isoform X2 [Mizuhopecten yessoensis]
MAYVSALIVLSSECSELFHQNRRTGNRTSLVWYTRTTVLDKNLQVRVHIFLMFGRNPRLPVDLAFGLNTDAEAVSMTRYIDDIRQRLINASELAASHSAKAKDRQKGHYDSRVREAVINTGDRVLVKIVAFTGKHKLSNKWEEEPYIVTEQSNPDIPAYIVRKKNGEGRPRTLHRNLLLSIGYLLDTTVRKPQPAPRKRTPVARKVPSSDEGSTISSSEGEEVLVGRTDVQQTFTPDHPLAESEDEPQDDAESQSQLEGDGGVPQDSPAAPRRSRRPREKPVWMRSGQFVMRNQLMVEEPEWKQRAKCLTELADTGILSGKEDQVALTLLQILSGKIS